MKKLSQVQEETRNSKEEAKRKHARECQRLLESCKDVEPRAIAFRDKLRKHLEAGTAILMGFACDHCGTELITERNVRLMTHPPKIPLGCPGCGWRGSMVDPR